MKIVLFEDNQCDTIRPAGLFKPLFELQIASWTLYDMVQLLDLPVLTIVRDHFLFGEHTNPDIKSSGDDSLLFLNASVEPDCAYLKIIRDLARSGDPFISTSGNRVASAFIPPGKVFPESISTHTVSSILLEMGLPLERELFRTIDWPHMIVESHARLFDSNIENRIATGNYRETEKGIFTNGEVEISPTCVFETKKGPVVIESGVNVMPFTYIEGPVYINHDTRIIEHSSIKDRTGIGSGCKIGGEIEVSTIEPHSNKQHHGFLGHSWVGSWVNLGAGTSTSDLKNTYGNVRMDYGGTRMDTGMQFLGSIIGDFVKTAVNTSFFTGKLIGTCSLIYGMVTTNIPSFSNYARSFGQITEISLEQVIITQKRMFSRRGVTQTPYDIELAKRIFEITRNERIISDEQINF